MGIGSYAGNSDETDKQKPSPDIYQGGATGLSTAATDNISELLFKILEFTQHRQKILIQNINFADKSGFVPKDLPVDEFADLMFLALSEHTNSQRLLLCDGRDVKFGAEGSFEVRIITDEQAGRLLSENRDEYLQYEVNKLFENSLNQRIACELIRHRQSDELCPGKRQN